MFQARELSAYAIFHSVGCSLFRDNFGQWWLQSQRQLIRARPLGLWCFGFYRQIGGLVMMGCAILIRLLDYL